MTVQATQALPERKKPSPLYLLILGALLLYLSAVILRTFFPFSTLTDTVVLFYRQDMWLLPAEVGLLLLACVRLPEKGSRLALVGSAPLLAASGLLLVCYAGSKWLLCGYALSRDEAMAVFDSRIFGAGHLVQPLPTLWQSHAAALNTMYMLSAAHPVAWVSAYLPMSAALRTLVGMFADPALTGPLMVGIGAILLWRCARLLWPDDREAAVVALLLYVTSAQVLFAGMTAFAMPAHLAFNLLWLWLFLLNRRIADLSALLVAFVATGLHQPLFHPLFAAPFLFILLRDRDWPRAALYAIEYAAICLFWLEWPNWMQHLVTGASAVSAPAGTDYFSRLFLTLAKGDPDRWQDMGANLLRFVAWQPLLLLPLMAAGLAAVRHERFAGALAAGVILTVLIMLVILPSQGHGFGYRYLHGLIGSSILLAVYGWRWLVAECTWFRPLLVRTSLAGLIVVLPLQAWMAHDFYADYAKIDRRISASGADYFITGPNDVPYTKDLVVNRPDLSNRPIRLLAPGVDSSLIQSICRSGARVAMPTGALYHPIETYFLLAHQTRADTLIAELSPRLKTAGCTVERLDVK